MAGSTITFVVLATLCWGLSGGIGSMLISGGWNAFVVSFYRGAVGLVFVLAWLILRPGGSGLTNRRLWFWSVIAGLGVAGNFTFYFVSIAQGNVAVAATLMYSAPVFVYIVSFVLKLERPTAFKLTAIAVVMVGIVLLTKMYDIDALDLTVVGVAAGLLAGLSYGLFIFAFSYAAPHGSPQAILSIAFSVLTLMLLWSTDTAEIIAVPASPDVFLFVLLGVLGAGLSFVLYIIGLRHTTPTDASIVAMVEPVTAALFGVVVLNVALAGPQLIGMALILITVTALSACSSSRGPRA